MDVTVMSGVTDRNNLRVLIVTSYQYAFMCVFICFVTVFVQKSGLLQKQFCEQRQNSLVR